MTVRLRGQCHGEEAFVELAQSVVHDTDKQLWNEYNQEESSIKSLHTVLRNSMALFPKKSGEIIVKNWQYDYSHLFVHLQTMLYQSWETESIKPPSVAPPVEDVINRDSLPNNTALAILARHVINMQSVVTKQARFLDVCQKKGEIMKQIAPCVDMLAKAKPISLADISAILGRALEDFLATVDNIDDLDPLAIIPRGAYVIATLQFRTALTFSIMRVVTQYAKV